MRLFILLLCVCLIGCATTAPHQSVYSKQISEIELAYKNKQITYAEYLNLKDNVEDAKQQHKATVLSAYIKGRY